MNNSLAHNWDYGDASPPEAWENPGKGPQSPINILTADVTKGKDRGLKTCYQAGPAELHFKYPSLELKPQTDGGWGLIEIDGERWKLAKIHAHAPGEHAIDGNFYPCEIHFVHFRAEKPLNPVPPEKVDAKVLGVFVAKGGDTDVVPHWPFLEMLTGGGNYELGREGLALRPNKANLDPDELLPLPIEREFYSYSGSLTTPPCSLGVEFFLLQTPIMRSSAQLAEYDDLFPGKTNRPLQTLYAARNVQSS